MANLFSLIFNGKRLATKVFIQRLRYSILTKAQAMALHKKASMIKASQKRNPAERNNKLGFGAGGQSGRA